MGAGETCGNMCDNCPGTSPPALIERLCPRRLGQHVLRRFRSGGVASFGGAGEGGAAARHARPRQGEGAGRQRTDGGAHGSGVILRGSPQSGRADQGEAQPRPGHLYTLTRTLGSCGRMQAERPSKHCSESDA